MRFASGLFKLSPFSPFDRLAADSCRPVTRMVDLGGPAAATIGSGASECPEGPAGFAPGDRVEGAAPVDDLRCGGAGGQAVRVDV